MPKVTQGHSRAKTEARAAVPSPTAGIFLFAIQPEKPNICKTYDSRVEAKPKPLQKRAFDLNE